MLPHIGQSRTSIQPRHALLTPESYERLTLPGWRGAEIIYLLSPGMGARLSMFLVEAGAALTVPDAAASFRRFVFLLSGQGKLVSDGADRLLEAEDFVFLPDCGMGRLEISAGTKLVTFEWRADTDVELGAPEIVCGNVADAPRQPLKGDSALMVQNLLPKQAAFDAEVNVMNFAPGASLPYVETHFMEHGLLFLSGQGVYRLGERWYPVTKGDAIWMGPHELQWFGALGKSESRYLIWKNFNRRPD
ncbi:MAG: (S)-ureidoglycine aminohydrolase [Mesorhizobium sp.]